MTEHRIEIHYCRQCRWLLRAAWMAQELLLTFEENLAEVALRPGTGGIFEVRLDGEVLWSRHEKGRSSNWCAPGSRPTATSATPSAR
jgi:selenoprotein W-related protein